MYPKNRRMRPRSADSKVQMTALILTSVPTQTRLSAGLIHNSPAAVGRAAVGWTCLPKAQVAPNEIQQSIPDPSIHPSSPGQGKGKRQVLRRRSTSIHFNYSSTNSTSHSLHLTVFEFTTPSARSGVIQVCGPFFLAPATARTYCGRCSFPHPGPLTFSIPNLASAPPSNNRTIISFTIRGPVELFDWSTQPLELAFSH